VIAATAAAVPQSTAVVDVVLRAVELAAQIYHHWSAADQPGKRFPLVLSI
jgi:hypothetical protein